MKDLLQLVTKDQKYCLHFIIRTMAEYETFIRKQNMDQLMRLLKKVFIQFPKFYTKTISPHLDVATAHYQQPLLVWLWLD